MHGATDGVDMDERDVAADSGGPRASDARSQGEDPDATYRDLFTAAATAAPRTEPAPPPRRRLTRRTLIVAAAVVMVLVVGAVAGGLVWAAQSRKQPARDALAAGDSAFESVATELRRATSIDDLRAAARPAGATAERIDRAARPLATPSTDLERGVRDVLRDESEVLRAAATLATLDLASLGDWPEARDTMAAAETSLDRDVKRLAAMESAARTVRTGRALAAHSDEVVGEFAGTSATDLLTARLGTLVAARTTADLRAVARRTAQAESAVDLALAGVEPGGAQAARITGVGKALDVLTRLRTVTGDRLGAWPAIRTDLVAAATGLESVDPRNAVGAVDALVSRGTARVKAWQTATAKARARNQKDAASLARYAAEVDAALADQASLDQASSAFLDRVRTDATLTSAQAVAYLDGATEAWDAVRRSLTATTAPKRIARRHQALVDVADQAASAVASGYQGTKKEKCGKLPPADPTDPTSKPQPAPCLYRDTGGWTAWSSGTTAATQALPPARQAWDQAVTDLRAAITGRKLPPRPVV